VRQSPKNTAAVQSFSEGIRLTVRAKPACSRSAQACFVDIGNGKQALEVSVSAVAVDGKANKAIQEAIAALFDVKKQAVVLKSGQTSRLKIIEVYGDAALLMQRAALFP